MPERTPISVDITWMRDMGAPEAFIAHLETTGEIDGRLWPIRWPIQRTSAPQEG